MYIAPNPEPTMSRMKRVLTFTLLLLIPTLLAVGLAKAQDEEDTYLRIDYLEIPSDKEYRFLDKETELWKPIYKELKNRGGLVSWRLYKVLAADHGRSHNYVMIHEFTEMSLLDNKELNQSVREVYPDKPETFYKNLSVYRSVDRSEVWQMNGDLTGSERNRAGGPFLTFNYFETRGMSGEHAELEFGFWQKNHQLRIERGILNSWVMYTLLYPSGESTDYTYSTIDYYDSLEHLLLSPDMELASAAHPDLSEEELEHYFDRTDEARIIILNELLKRVAAVE